MLNILYKKLHEKKVIAFVSIVLLIGTLIILTGCSDKSKENSKEETKNTSANDEHLINVLKGTEKYKYSLEEYDGISYYEDSNMGLDFYINETPYIFEDISNSPIKDYTLIDIDGDSKNEIVANINHTGGFVLILNRENNINYGYILSIRSFNTLKADGKFLSSSSSTNVSIHKAEFIDEMMNIQTIAYTDSTNFYNGNDEQITEDEYNKILNEFNNSKDAEFITLNNTESN